MNLKPGILGTDESPVPGEQPHATRYLYIVSQASVTPKQVFAAMREDMASASVQLVYDRRGGDRRSERAPVDTERRASDRRRLDFTKDIAQSGWARVRVD